MQQQKRSRWREWIKWAALAAFGIGMWRNVLVDDAPSSMPAEPAMDAVASPLPSVPNGTPHRADSVAVDHQLQSQPAAEQYVPEVAGAQQDDKEKPKANQATVYTTRTGNHYHRSGCSSLRKSRNATTVAEALSWGYQPCHRCSPPR